VTTHDNPAVAAALSVDPANHPALFQIGVQKTSVPSDVAQTIAPAADRALVALHRRIARLRDTGRIGARTISERPGNSTPPATDWPPSNCAAPSP
jgi:hypothetical protein